MNQSNKKVTIVMYHYVRDLKYSRYRDIKALDYRLFKEQILFLKKHYNFVTMEEVISSIWNKEELPEKAVLLTFDDAYKDHYTYVFPFLDEMGIQGSFFLPVKAITENKVLDVNKIHFILASEKNKEYIIKEIFALLDKYRNEYNLLDNTFYFNKLAKETRFDSKETIFIKRLLQTELNENVRNRITDKLFEKYVGMDEGSFSRELYMDLNQIKVMVRHGMHFGSHGYDHYWLESLDRKDQEKEIKISLDFLKNIGVDMKNWTMCYPYGSYNNDTISLLQELECKLALTTKVAIADLEKDNKYKIPRLDTNDLPKDKSLSPNEWYKNI